MEQLNLFLSPSARKQLQNKQKIFLISRSYMYGMAIAMYRTDVMQENYAMLRNRKLQ
jgi:hypothetical protein